MFRTTLPRAVVAALFVMVATTPPVTGQESDGGTGRIAADGEPTDDAGRTPAAEASDLELEAPIEEIEVIGRPRLVTPLPGLGFDERQLTTKIQTVTAEDIRKSGAINATEFLNQQLQSITVSDTAGNPFQQEVNFRGFSASPDIATPQGVSVYIDGVRVNEAIGEIINWDLVPLNAIDAMTLVPGANPLFGRNTLSGALSIGTKSGFSHPGLDVSLRYGSWDRLQTDVTVGANDGTFGAFAAVNRVTENGWRVNSPSELFQFFGRGDFRSRWANLSLSAMLADNELVGNGLVPFGDFEEDPEQIFTAPDVTTNSLRQFNVTGTFFPSDDITISMTGYRRDVDQDRLDGDVWDDWERVGASRFGWDCSNFGSSAAGGNGSFRGEPGVPGCEPNGLFNIGTRQQDGYGATLQIQWTTERNQAVLGYTFDRTKVEFSQAQLLGFIDDDRTVFVDPTRRVGNQLAGPPFFGDPQAFLDLCTAFIGSLAECQDRLRDDEIQRFNLATAEPIVRTQLFGESSNTAFFFYDAFNLTDSLTVTAGVRHNRTRVRNRLEFDEPSPLWTFITSVFENQTLECKQGPDDPTRRLQCTEEEIVFDSWNPSIGFSYQVTETLSVSGNASWGTRTPSAIELACAEPPREQVVEQGLIVGCTIPSIGSADPPLEQVRSRSIEFGAKYALGETDIRVDASVFRTDLTDDILFISLGRGNRGVFKNFGQTRRQGVEIGLSDDFGALSWFVNYTWLEPTFQSPATAVNASNSTAARGFSEIHEFDIEPGDVLPGIPAHSLRAGISYAFTPRLEAGFTLQAQTASYARGNENNDHQPIGNDEFSFGVGGSGGPCGPYPEIDGECFTGGRPFVGRGQIGAFWVLGFDATFRPTERVTVNLAIDNVLDKRFTTAGNLAFSPFQSDSVNFPGAVDAAGFNYNSLNWKHDLFVGPGAPRAAWVSVRYTLEDW